MLLVDSRMFFIPSFFFFILASGVVFCCQHFFDPLIWNISKVCLFLLGNLEYYPSSLYFLSRIFLILANLMFPYGYIQLLFFHRASLVAHTVKNLPAVQETQVRSLEKGMTIHSNILAWKIPGQRSLVK